MSHKNNLLLLTDFSYQARGREYYREDVELSIFLRKFFHVCISHIDDAEKFIHAVDVILIRNTGPQMTHEKQLKKLQQNKNVLLFNDLKGKGDIQGKYHLLELFKAGFPVIPTFQYKEDLKSLRYDRYLLKPLDGADSHGVKILNHEELLKDDSHKVLIQPLIPFQYEVSFYFIDNEFQYALNAPNTEKRWELQPYIASDEDIAFALKFILWNTCQTGIQRVDACRCQDGKLLLMELEDYNPFLSLDLLSPDVKQHFLETLCRHLQELIVRRKGIR